jgi:hypothetical protein
MQKNKPHAVSQYAQRSAMANALVVGIAIILLFLWITMTARTIKNTRFALSPVPRTVREPLEKLKNDMERLWRTERIRAMFRQGLEQ